MSSRQAAQPAGYKPPKEFKIAQWHNPRIRRSRFTFHYESPDEPRLVMLREKYRLDEVVEAGKDEFEKQQLLRGWVCSRWPHGWDDVVPAVNALDILAAAEQGHVFACGYYNVVFVQCCLALGWQARSLAISKQGSDFYPPWEGNIGHSVTEVWSNQYCKWILMDADTNSHYVLDGEPLGGLEMHRAWFTGDWERLERVTGEPAPRVAYDKAKDFDARHEFERFNRHYTTDYFAYLAVVMGNDLLSTGQTRETLMWCDDYTPYRIVDHNHVMSGPWTQNEDDINWTLGQAHISVRGLAEDRLKPQREVLVELETQDPWFDHFELKIGDGDWKRADGKQLTMRLADGDTLISARTVNKLGVPGHVHWVRLRWEEWPAEPFPGKMRPCY